MIVGQYTVINHQDFKEGKVKSCGCLSTEQKRERCKSIINTAVDFSSSERNINPFYEYIAPTIERKRGQVVWKIKCRKCEQYYYDLPNELISEKRNHGNNPCTCWKKHSIGVQKIITLLNAYHINYEQEKTFKTCISDKGYLLPFDFYLPNYNILIEYDGEQHYKICFNNTKEELLAQQKRDKIKDLWCLNNNIKLIRIPYYYKNFTINDLIK